MARLQIGFIGNYGGRGVLGRLLGAGPVRFTPIDIRLKDADVAKARAASETLWCLVREKPLASFRIGSVIEVCDLRPVIYVREE